MPTTKSKYTLHDLVKQYEGKNIQISDTVYLAIVELINKSYTEIAYLAAKSKLVNNRFLPKPIRTKIDSILSTLNDKITIEVQKGVVKSWILSEEKHEEIETETFGGSNKPPTKTFTVSGDMESNYGRVQKSFGNGSESALREFMNRKEQGLNLSKRVWKQSPHFKKYITDTLADGIKTGTSARELSRRLRDANYRPKNAEDPRGQGQGVYKDPKKNALRLAATEINMAYRANDTRHYKNSWWILGKRVLTSGNHPKYDICDELAGDYPSDFNFPGWHPRCICYTVPILATVADREAMSDFNLGITDEKPVLKYITTIPAAAAEWVKANRKRIDGWKNQPYFLANNEKYF